MRARVTVLIFLLCLSVGVSSYLALGQGVTKEVFASRPFKPADFTSYKVDATVFQPPGWQVYDEGESDQSSRAYSIGAPGLVTSLALGWMQKSGKHLVFFTGAINGSADAWTHIQLKDSEGIPDKVGPEEVDGVGVRIKGKIKRINFTLAVCGLSWTQAFGKITINGLEGDLSILKVGNAPAGPSLDFDPCLPGPQAATGIDKASEVIRELIGATGALLDAFSTAGVALGPEEEYEALFMLPSSIKREELLAKVLGKKPLDVSIQLGFRSSAALAAGALSGGYITIDSVELVGFAGVEPVVHLEVWYYFHQEGFLTRRLAEVQEYNIKKAQYGIEPYPSISITCPIPYPGLPTIRQRGKLYVISGDRLWRLDYLQLDDGQRTPVQGDTCSFGPIVMDQSHKLVFGFERAVADLIVAGFRTDPPSSSLQQGQEFKVFMEVINIGEISALEADRRSPISGETKVHVTAIGTGVTGEATIKGGLCGQPGQEKDCSLQPGETRTIQVAGPPKGWIAPRDAQNLVLQATIDPDDVIDEGISGEQNNTASLVVYLAAPTLPDPAFEDPNADVGFTQISKTILRLRADVSNLSPLAAQGVVVRFFDGEEKVIGEKTIRLLAGNSRERVELDWDISRETPGRHVVVIVIDPDKKINDLNRRNNSAFLEITITQPLFTLTIEALCGSGTPLAGQTLPGIKVNATPPGTMLTTPASQRYAPNTSVELQVLDLQLIACHQFGAPIPVFFSHWEINGQAQSTGRTKITLTLTHDTTARAIYTMTRCTMLETNKKEYQTGEPVTIRFINGCQATLTLRNSAPWVIKDSQGRVVFTPFSLPVITEVKQGETKTWTWDQKDNNGRQVPAGTYTVELETMDAGTYTASFEIKALAQAKLSVRASCDNARIKVTPPGITVTGPKFGSFTYPQGATVELEALDRQLNSCGMLQVLSVFKQWEVQVGTSKTTFTTPKIQIALKQDTTATAIYESAQQIITISKACKDALEVIQDKLPPGRCWNWYMTHTYDLGQRYELIAVTGATIAGPSEQKGKKFTWQLRLSEDGQKWFTDPKWVIEAEVGQKKSFSIDLTTQGKGRIARYVQIFAGPGIGKDQACVSKNGCVDWSEIQVSARR